MTPLNVEVKTMNEIERLIKNLEPHVKNHKGKECELWVNIEGKNYRLTGAVSTYMEQVVFFATTTGKPTFHE
jgi:hypothetical protein